MRGAARVRVIALGSPHGGDDEAALELAARLRAGDDGGSGGVDAGALEVIEAGRPGPGLVDLLDVPVPVLLLDVVRSGAAPGTIHALDLATLVDASIARGQVSSHGFGPAEALRLAAALGRALPPGRFVGVEGARFDLGAGLSPEVAAARAAFAAAARQALAELRADAASAASEETEMEEQTPCMSPG